jgi:hypothetical protein
MDDRQIQLLAREIANQTAYRSWEYWLALLAVAIVGAAASFFGSYFKKRGEHSATEADLNKSWTNSWPSALPWVHRR